jgi:hypothetical protein
MMDGLEITNRIRGPNAVSDIDYGDMPVETWPSVCSNILGIDIYKSPLYVAVRRVIQYGDTYYFC